MEEIVFFTMNDFQKEGGGTIRILGIINELAKHRDNIVLISNITDKSKVNHKIKHIPINMKFSPDDKRKFQFLLGAFGYSVLNKKFGNQLKVLESIFAQIDKKAKIIFFEYLDNSFGYWLKKNKIISGYINDIHGIASNEFIFQRKKATSVKSKVFLKIKELISNSLDKKVFNNAEGIIYASRAMLEYFTKLYPSIVSKKNYYLPYVLNNDNIKPPDAVIVEKIKSELRIDQSDFIFLFAGAYKETGGIQDLILAFDELSTDYKNVKLILVGDGPTFENCKELKESLSSADRIFQLGRQPYHYLSSFQSLANVIVCPDRQNLFSDLIVHVKYLDALISGKIVINGSFKSVMEINENDKLSLTFSPSDVKDLKNKMEESMVKYNDLNEKYKFANRYTVENLTYKNYIKNLLNN